MQTYPPIHSCQRIKLFFVMWILLGHTTSSLAEYLKISNDGNVLPKLAASGSGIDDWGCTYDSESNLIWEYKTQDGGLRDIKHTYSWFNTDAKLNGGNAGVANGGICFDKNNCDTEKFVNQVNTQGLCGAKDWRLPALEELKTIKTPTPFSTDSSDDAIPDFYGHLYYGFWSATLGATNKRAWGITWNWVENPLGLYEVFSSTEVDKSIPQGVRLVRHSVSPLTENYKESAFKVAQSWTVNNPQSFAIAADNSLFAIEVEGDNKRLVALKADGTRSVFFERSESGYAVVKVAADGSVFMVDVANARIKAFKQDGSLAADFGGNGTDEGQIDQFKSLAVAADNSLFVLDALKTPDDGGFRHVFRIQHFKADGTFIGSFKYDGGFPNAAYFGHTAFNEIAMAYDGSLFIHYSGSAWSGGTGGRFTSTYGVIHYQTDGTLLSRAAHKQGGEGLSIAPDGYSLLFIENKAIVRYAISTLGMGGSGNNQYIGQLAPFSTKPTAISITPDGDLYVADASSNRIQKITSAAEYTYDNSVGVAIFENIMVGKTHYWVKLQNQGNFQFKVIKAYPIQPALDYSEAAFDPNTGLAVLPNVIANGVNFKVVLHRLSNGLFGVLSASAL